MYNEHFQYGQRVNTSAFGAESAFKPSPFRLQAQRGQSEPLTASSSNAIIIQKIEALFPILQEMAGKNDMRANHIIGKLLGLKESLDVVFGQVENEIDQTENENNNLKSKLRKVEGQTKTVYVEDTQALRKLEREVEALKRENSQLRNQTAGNSDKIRRAEQENQRTFDQLDRLKNESSKLLQRNKELEKFRQENDFEAIQQEINEERKRSMGAQEYARRKYNEYERSLQQEKSKAEQIKRAQVDYDSKNFET